MDAVRENGVWIFAEQTGGRPARITFELLGWGRGLADRRGVPLTAVVFAERFDDETAQGLVACGADHVLAVEDPALAYFRVRPYAACLTALIRKRRPEILLAGATTLGRTLLPYVAARVRAGLTADCTGLDIDPETGGLLQTRPAIGGNILATIVTPEARPQMATVRPHSRPPAPAVPGRSGRIERVSPAPARWAAPCERIDFTPIGEGPGIQDAEIVVAAGRGIGKAENLKLVRELADLLGAAVGASRDVVDRGWLGYPHQVGLSGKTISPRLYLALGVSGAIQHLAGIQTAEHIVAVNQDPEAQIFQVAELGVVGDLFEVVPALIRRLRARRADPPGTATPESMDSGRRIGKRPVPAQIPESAPPEPAPTPAGCPPRTYARISGDILEALRGIVGDRHVLAGEPEELERYGHDEIADPRYARMPEAVVRPKSAAEIAAIMKLANARGFPVTPRGAGSGLSGGAVPVCGGIVLSLERMNRILEIDPENMMIEVEPGVVTNEINERVRPLGLFYAGYPMSLETCFIGGNVAENAGGGKAVKYGVTGRYVAGLELVTPTGDIVRLGGRRVKDVTGYNLLQLMIGSEGTLGIFTRITLRLLPLPKAAVDLLCLFESPEAAIAAVPKITTRSGVVPTAIEFMDEPSFRAACEYLNESLPYDRAGAMLLITVDGADSAEVARSSDRIGEECLEAGAVEVYVADNPTTSERLWKIRRNIAEAFKVISPDQSLEDIVVPIAAIPKMVRALQELSEKYGVAIPCYGHAGDGNLHATPVMNPEWSREKWRRVLPALLEEMYATAAELGGTISGEHGIGHKRREFMPLVLDPAALELMRAVKRALDPNQVLNPGKILPHA